MNANEIHAYILSLELYRASVEAILKSDMTDAEKVEDIKLLKC